MFGIGFALAIVGVWLVDSAVQGRHPITVLKEIIERPTMARATLTDSKHKLSPIADISNALSLTDQTANPSLDTTPHSNAAGPTHSAAYVTSNGMPPGIAPVMTNGNPGEMAVSFAEQQVGKPYVYGAEGPNAYDCSGLMFAAWRVAGVTIPRTTWAMLASKSMIRVRKKDLRPGDIVFPYPSHCFMYIGDNRVVEAAHPGTKIHIVNMYQFATARRPK